MASWLFLAVLVIIWAVCVFPRARGRSPAVSVMEFERGLDLLAETRRADGRWIVAPRKGAQFLGVRNRARMRARARRRRVFVFLLEVMFLTFLMGLFPPLRPFWYATSAFFGMLTLYVVLLLTISRNDRELQRMQQRGRCTRGRGSPIRSSQRICPGRSDSTTTRSANCAASSMKSVARRLVTAMAR